MVYPPLNSLEDMEKYPEVIRIDGQTRKNVGASLNDIIKIKKVTTKVAKSVVLPHPYAALQAASVRGCRAARRD